MKFLRGLSARRGKEIAAYESTNDERQDECDSLPLEIDDLLLTCQD
jgi:hypothetical protein